MPEPSHPRSCSQQRSSFRPLVLSCSGCINYDTLKMWAERSAGVHLRPIPAITYHVHIYRGDESIGRFDSENQIAMGGDLSGQVLKYLEELGYKRSSKG